MLKAGTQAPLFQLADDEGRETSLQHHLAGGPVVVAFFKISCPTCQFAFPYLNRLFQEGGVPVLGVSQNDALATRGFRSAYGLSFQTLLDSAEAGYPVSNAYRITHVPSLFLIEQDRSISISEAGFSRMAFDQIARRFGGQAFREGEQIPEYKPG